MLSPRRAHQDSCRFKSSQLNGDRLNIRSYAPGDLSRMKSAPIVVPIQRKDLKCRLVDVKFVVFSQHMLFFPNSFYRVLALVNITLLVRATW